MSLLITQRQLAAVAGFKGISQILAPRCNIGRALRTRFSMLTGQYCITCAALVPKWREKHPDMS